ncbi:MAG: hypothetical protein IT479_03445 [Xanthomonadales bacterium]|nr:hypothetical protein [Xanthomonadales bacterium]MCC6592305.1 hypothetical protein [Xanthomonadales bacterium]MCE7931577.1 hypothetical protein [Xanthomonadales bacterium PRO6]
MRSIPLLLIPAILVHALLLGGGGFAQSWFSATLPSGATFVLDAGTAVLAVALVTLFAEVFKATHSSRASFLDHLLSLLLFVLLLLEFLLWKAAGHPVVALLVLMALVDVIAGFAVGIAVARRDVGFVRE